jgi:uncharacterized membrane protein (UPF0127 family)
MLMIKLQRCVRMEFKNCFLKIPAKARRFMVCMAAATALFLPGLTAAQQVPQINLQRVKLNAGMHVIDAQVALTPQERQIGLMQRKDMPQHEGMLFVFEQASEQCFWMKNTLLPLTAAFVADDGTIVNTADMKPESTDSHCSAKPVRYVLEMNKGWFVKKGIKQGSKLSGPMFEVPR